MNKSINITGPVSNLSYGYIVQFLVKYLIKDGWKVNLKSIGPTEPDSTAGLDEYVNQCSPDFDEASPHLIVWHHHGLQQYVIPGLVNIGFPIFEVNVFNEDEIFQINSVNRLFVTCQFYKEILQKVTKKPIDIINLGVDTDIFSEDKLQQIRPDNMVRFIHVGKWEIRKSIDIIIKAFGEEFRKDRDASLTLVCDNPFLDSDNQKWAEYARKHIYDDQLNILPCRLNSILDIANIMNQHQIGLFPAKAEGWNLDLHEMLALNKLVVTTNWSAHTEYINHPDIQSNIFSIVPQTTEAAFDGEFFFGQGTWASFTPKNIENLKLGMRKSFDKVKKGYDKPKIQGFRGRFSWANTVEQLKGALANVN